MDVFMVVDAPQLPALLVPEAADLPHLPHGRPQGIQQQPGPGPGPAPGSGPGGARQRPGRSSPKRWLSVWNSSRAGRQIAFTAFEDLICGKIWISFFGFLIVQSHVRASILFYKCSFLLFFTNAIYLDSEFRSTQWQNIRGYAKLFFIFTRIMSYYKTFYSYSNTRIKLHDNEVKIIQE